MKKCTWCGKEYPDDATVCATDEQPLKLVGSQGSDAHKEGTLKSAASISDSSEIAAAKRKMLVGACWGIGGILVTAVTYRVAASSAKGGSFIVAWGAVIYGLRQMYRGASVVNPGSKNLDSPDPQRDARQLLDEAARLESVDFQKAISAYEEIIRQYPETRASRQAASAIEVLKRSV